MKGRVLVASILLLFLVNLGLALDHKRDYAEFDGNKVYYLDTGGKKKDALVLIHGWTCNLEFWKDSYSAFPGQRVIAVDLIGHGKSDKPKATYSMEYFARSGDAVLKKAGVNRAVLVGHSMGTPVARQFYRLYTQKTLGIVVVDGALKQFAPKETMEGFLAPLRTDFKANAGGFIDGMLQPVKDESLKKFIREGMLATPEHVAISAWSGMADDAIWTNDQIKVPVLALMAPGPFWPADVKQIFSSVAPDIDFQMWTGVSHFLMMEKPKEFNEQVALFVSKKKLL